MAKAKPARRGRIALLILGMHRAGTSAVTRLCSLLGADLPDDLIGSSKSNVSGYWESRPIVEFDDRALAAAASFWSDWRPLGSEWLKAAVNGALGREARRVLATVVGDSKFFVLKDPRMCRLAPLWFDAVQRSGAVAHTVVVVRNPIEVAASLSVRDKFPQEFSYRLWLRHMLDAEHYSRGRPRVFVSYGRLLRNWQADLVRVGETLGIDWPRGPDAIVAEVDAFLTREHRHHVSSYHAVASDPFVSDWLKITFEILDRWTEEGESQADFATLDSIRNALDTAGRNLAPIRSNGSTDDERARQTDSILEKPDGPAQPYDGPDDEIASLKLSLAAGAAKRNRLRIELDQALLAVDTLKDELNLTRSTAIDLTRLAEPIGEFDRRRPSVVIAELRERLANATARYETAERRAGQLESEQQVALARIAVELEHWREDSVRQRSAAVEREVALAQHLEAESQLSQLCGTLEDQLSRRTVELARVSEYLRQSEIRERMLKGRLESVEASARTEAERQNQLKAELLASEARVEAERGNVESLKQRIAGLEQAVVRSEAERVAVELHFDKLRQIFAALLNEQDGIRHTNPDLIRQRMTVVERSGLFDADWYLTVNSDVKDAGLDPLRHFAEYGLFEGRAPNGRESNQS